MPWEFPIYKNLKTEWRVNHDEHVASAGGADETKYMKHKRIYFRHNNSICYKGQPIWSGWSTRRIIFVGAIGFMLLFVFLNDSSKSWRHQQVREHLMKRALHILNQRRTQNNSSNGENTITNNNSDINQKHEKEVKFLDKNQDGKDRGNEEEEELQTPIPQNSQKQQRFRKRSAEDQNGFDMEELRHVFRELNKQVRRNLHGGIRWIRDQLLKELPGQEPNRLLNDTPKGNIQKKMMQMFYGTEVEYVVGRMDQKPMAWETEWEELSEEQRNHGPKVDFTTRSYAYTKIEATPPDDYPPLEPLGALLSRWPQDSIDDPPTSIIERLMRFDFSNVTERQMAMSYRDAELPFKVYNVPEVDAATAKWTDDYLIAGFDGGSPLFLTGPRVQISNCQESPDNFFAFYVSTHWHIGKLGPPPYRNNDWNFRKWNQHAKYADAVSLSFDQPHFYWQAGILDEELQRPKNAWSFIPRDLPSFSSTEANFFQFHPDEQKGIQCRFGERGVTAATHYDSGRNMIAMIQGAKRYILSPPRECPKLGIVTRRGNPIFRHSLLNFGHIQYLNDNKDESHNHDAVPSPTLATTPEKGHDMMPEQERKWLEVSRDALAIETVLKAGEVLYVPSHWFHYITSLQKSAQCNVRSGIDKRGTEKFGGLPHVTEC